MHEISIVRSVVKTVLEYCESNEVPEVAEIVMSVGELSLVIPEYLEKSYPVVVKGTPLEQTKLVIEVVPGMAECNACDEVFNVVENKGYCPNCGSFDKDVLSGKDCSIKEIHVPEQDAPADGPEQPASEQPD